MKISRDFQRPFRYFFDQVVPPFIRDSWVFRVALYGIFRSDSSIVWNFRKEFGKLSDLEIQQIYSQLASRALKVQTDLNEKCISRIRAITTGASLLDVGCGTGALAKLVNAGKYQGIDFVSHQTWSELESENTHFRTATVQNLPFEDKSFDNVVCAHVLEHVKDPQMVIDELIRCCQNKVIIVLPKERSYKSGFNLHVHQFQYQWEVEALLSRVKFDVLIEELDGDFYIEIEKKSQHSKNWNA